MYHGGSFLKLADDNKYIKNPEAQKLPEVFWSKKNRTSVSLLALLQSYTGCDIENQEWQDSVSAVTIA